MSSAHLLYIPIFVLVGMALGFGLGRKAGTQAQQDAARRVEERAARVAEMKRQLKPGSDDS